MSGGESYGELEGRVAGFISRLVAFSIDAVLLVVLVAAGSWITVQIERIFETFLPGDLGLDGAYIFVVPVIIGGYYVGLWALTGATVGKRLLGLRVVGPNGDPPTIARSLVRFVGYGLSAIVFFLGFIWVLFDDERRAWHDELSGTWVVYDFQRRLRGEAYSHRVES